MNPYEQMMQSLMAQREPASPVPVGLAAFKTDVDVAENISHDKLAKKKYNPYNLIQDRPSESEIQAEGSLGARDNFRKEMLRDIGR